MWGQREALYGCAAPEPCSRTIGRLFRGERMVGGEDCVCAATPGLVHIMA
jgi:hypothetical protein